MTKTEESGDQIPGTQSAEGRGAESRPWQRELDEAIDRRFERMKELRCHLHRNPELSGRERESSLLLYQLLGNEGLDVRLGVDGCGVIAEQRGMGDAGRVALRADLDALKIHDAKQTSYRSQRDGVMHACGHDAHTAIVYGALTALHDLRRADLLPWPVPLRAIFQPAEETCEGAQQMIRIGALEHVESILAVHCDPGRSVGSIGLRDGVLTATCDEMSVTITGRGGHAARPHETSDPIAVAAQLINSFYLFVPRATDSQDAVVVTIGKVHGGDNANVIPEQVVLQGTIRTLDRRVRDTTFRHIERLASGIATMSETSIKVAFGTGSGSVVNDSRLIALVKRVADEVLGDEQVEWIARPSMGSEDFSFYLNHVPGAMIRLGCASETTGQSPLHTPTFDVDERTLLCGARLLARAAVYRASGTR